MSRKIALIKDNTPNTSRMIVGIFRSTLDTPLDFLIKLKVMKVAITTRKTIIK
jgi:hypothetical protein